MTIIDLFTRLPIEPEVAAAKRVARYFGEVTLAGPAAAEEWDRDETIVAIRAALRERTGRAWSVTGGRGTSWGWIDVGAPPARRGGKWGPMTAEDRAMLAEALDLPVGSVGEAVAIPAGSDYRAEYVARARGEQPTVHGRPYWD